jgi:uncharacterized delta-60 repeat protein
MKKLGWLGTLLLLLVPAIAQAKPGQLDPSFAKLGKLVVAAPKPQPDESGVKYPAVPMAMATAPGGKLVSADSHTVEEFLAGGRPNRGFGRRGAVSLRVPEGWTFALASVAVDSHGRVLVAGTAESTAGRQAQGPLGLSGPPLDQATVYRFLPDGKPDTSFGAGGVVRSDFDQAPPTELRRSVRGEFAYGTASVRVSGLAVDVQDRPVVLGSSVSRVTECDYAGIPADFNRTYVARLTASAEPDRSFGSSGVVTDDLLEDPNGLALTPAGGIVHTNPSEERCPRYPTGKPPAVTLLNDNGGFDWRISSVGTNSSLEREVQAVAVDSRGRIVILLENNPIWDEEEWPPTPTIRRLLPNGSPDTSFGHGGSTSQTLPLRSNLLDLATDGRGRVLLAGSTPTKRGRAFLLMRLSAAGRREHDFGRGGSVITDFPGNAGASQIAIDQRHRIVVGGTMTTTRLPTGYGFVFARYRGGGH